MNTKKENQEIHVWFGRGQWVMSENVKEITRLNKIGDMTPLVLKVSEEPYETLKLEELLQEFVVKEEWPRVIQVLAASENTKSCCMSSTAIDICKMLIDGKRVWDESELENG